MIEFYFEMDFMLHNSTRYADWVSRVIRSEQYTIHTINYIFCEDTYLHRLNKEYLRHDSLTDILTFDYSDQGCLSGDIFISIERVQDNALTYGFGFDEELRRVMAHGLLHMMGYKDKSDEERIVMRSAETKKMELFHVKQ